LGLARGQRVLGEMSSLMRPSLVALLALATTGGCDFFQELDDAESAGEGGTTAGDSGGGTTGEPVEGAPCDLLQDDRCHDQDLLASCEPIEGVLSVVDCHALCGSFVNFSCVGTSSGQHACWCVEPGKQKVLACPELESCLADCADFGPCPDACFAKTTESTIRLYGALLHCAEDACDALCREDPTLCAGCVAQTRVDGAGDCTLARTLCDADKNDEPWSP
jgi:hypothetical protein